MNQNEILVNLLHVDHIVHVVFYKTIQYAHV